MTAISTETLANIHFRLHWAEDGVTHRDGYYAQNVNLWRDVFPGGLEKSILGLEAGGIADVRLTAGKHLPSFDGKKVFEVPRKNFRPAVEGISPVRGRFYPQGVLRGLPGVFPQNIQPFRIVESHEDRLVADLNHPLAGIDARLEIEALEVWPKQAEFGGQCQDWVCALTDGPGLKRRNAGGTDFGLDGVLETPLGGAAASFYATPRKVPHVDSRALLNISALYGRLLTGRSRVLDLMAGWQSHLPEGLQAAGLGMNAEEMADNPALSSFVVHDLNIDPALPYTDASFDAVVCSLSVEYLTRPVEVLREVARVLQPGGLFVAVFSHRWFPDQTVRVWTELHEFERAAMVTEMFRLSGRFEGIGTLSERGWPRPMDARDRYYPMIQHSDPVHAVWGTKAF